MRPLAATVRLNGCSAKIRRCASRSHVARVERSETGGGLAPLDGRPSLNPGYGAEPNYFTANWLTKLPSLQGKRATATTPGPEYFLFLSANLQARATVGEKRPSTCPLGLTEEFKSLT